jgi:hypothetical protein
MITELLSHLMEAQHNFKDTVYQPLVDQAEEYFSNDMIDEACKTLCKLPSEAELLKDLIEKLKGKSVYKTLKKMDEGKSKSDIESLKGLFSLGTHIVIECEKGKGEYRSLLPLIHERISELVYKIV